MKEIITTELAPAAAGPYSQAVRIGDTIFTSGQLALNAQGALVGEGDIRAQTKQVLENIRAVLAAAGAGPDDVVKTTVFLANGADFAGMNEVYRGYFGQRPPARSTVQAQPPREGALVEIEAVAVVSG